MNKSCHLKKSVSRLLVCTSVVVSSLGSLNCVNDSLDPVLPSWDVDLTLPLVNRSHSLLEIVQKDSSILRVGEGGEITYSLSEPLSPTTVGDLISLSLRDTSQSVKFGKFSVTSPDLVVPIVIPWLPQGATVPVPDTTLYVGDVRDTIPSFERVTFERGTINLTVRNNLPVPIEAVSPIVLVNEQNEAVATFNFNPSTINPNSSRTASQDLSNKTLDNVVQLTGISFHTPGSSTPVQLPVGSQLVVTLSTSNLKARQAILANIPPQRLTDNDSAEVPLDDSTLVKEVRIKSGGFTLSFQNQINLDILFKYRFAELERYVGGNYASYEDSVYLPAHGSGQKVVTLTNRRIVSRTANAIHSLLVISSVILPTGSVTPVTVNDTDRVSISMTSTSPIIADSVVGVLKPTWVNVNNSMKVNFGEFPTRFRGQLNIPSAAFKLGSLSRFDFPLDMYVKVTAAKNAAGDSAYLYLPASSRRLQPGADSVAFNASEVGQFLSQFSGSFPDSFRISGRILINPPDAYNPNVFGRIGAHSSFGGRVHLDVPMMLGIVDGTYNDTLTMGDTTGDGRRDYQIDRNRLRDVNSGKVYIEIENGMPVQVGLGMRLLRGTKEGLLRLPQSGVPVSIAPASVSGQGNVIAPARSTSLLELNEQDIRQFDPAEFLTYALDLRTTPGSPAVRFRTTDYVKIRVWSRMSYRVNK